MKIALLGARSTGKTAFFSGLYSAYRDELGFHPLTAKQISDFRSRNISERVGMSLRVITPDLDRNLARNTKMLRAQPIDPWPPYTTEIYGGRIEVTMRFAPVDSDPDGDDSSDDFRSYDRVIEFLDPPGGAVSGIADRSEEVQARLAEADAAIVFLPADKLVAAMRSADTSQLNHELSLGAVTDILKQANSRLTALAPRDRLPVAFVLCKYDKVHETDTQQLLTFLYDERNGYIVNISRNMPKLLICSVPIAIAKPWTNGGEVFNAWNLNWPFMFTVGATILRNSRVLRREAGDRQAEARELEAEANALRELWQTSKLGRVKVFFQDFFAGRRPRTASNITRQAGSIYMDYARNISLSKDDEELASDVWKSLFAEGKSCGVRFYEAGKPAEPK